MTQVKRRSSWLALFIVLGMVLTLTTAPGAVRAADHLDAPGLESPGDDPRLDVNDLLVFPGENEDNTVLVMTVNPAAPGDASFATKQEGSYHLRIDNTGDAIEDITYSFTFKNKGDGQKVKVRRATGESAQSARPRGDVIAQGFVGEAFEVPGGGTVLADLRSDPFFFDLIGFLETVEGMDVDPDRTGLGDGIVDGVDRADAVTLEHAMGALLGGDGRRAGVFPAERPRPVELLLRVDQHHQQRCVVQQRCNVGPDRVEHSSRPA